MTFTQGQEVPHANALSFFLRQIQGQSISRAALEVYAASVTTIWPKQIFTAAHISLYRAVLFF